MTLGVFDYNSCLRAAAWLALLWSTLALASVALAGCASGPAVPTSEDLEQACPGAAKVMLVDCPALAVSSCDGGTWDACADREAIEAECDRLLDVELRKCAVAK